MNRFFKPIFSGLLAGTLFLGMFSLAGCGGSGKTVLYVDAGGQSGNYNTSVLTGYDTLEELANEWNAANDQFEIVINRYSLNGGRDSIVVGLEGGTAPDILFQIGTTISEDLQNGWFVDLTDYLEQPNKYVEGNEHWSDLYDEKEFISTAAPDGRYYSVGIDKIVNGILYNADMLKQAGVTVDGTPDSEVKIPETYSEFVWAQKKLYDTFKKSDGTYYPYLPYAERYDIVLEGAVYANIIDQIDVLRVTGTCDAEEIVRAYKKGIYDLNDDLSRNGFLKAIKDKLYYKPSGYNMIPAIEAFINGNCAMIEVIGSEAIEIKNNPAAEGITMGMMPYPVLDTGTYPRMTADGQPLEDTYNAYGGKSVRRGSAGIGTPWWITNSASNKGQEAVEACVDFLMFVTAPENNNRMVGELGSAIPLNPSEDTAIDPIFDDVLRMYKEDMNDETKFAWHTFNASGSLGKDYYDTYVSNRSTFVASDDINGTDPYDWIVATLNGRNERSGLSLAVKNLIEINNYDQSKW